MGVWWSLWSINEVLQGREGAELPRPTLHWVFDVINAIKADAEELEEAEEEAAEERRKAQERARNPYPWLGF